MKVLLDGRLISNKPTGISRYSYEMIKIYQKKFGYDKVFVLLNNSSAIKEKNFNFIESKYRPFNIFHFIFFHFFLHRIDFDIYHSLFYSNSFFKKKNVIYIITIHDLMYRVVDDFFGKNIFKNFIGVKYYNFIVGKSISNSDHIISVSKTTMEDVYKFFLKNSTHISEGINEISVSNCEISGINKKDYFLYVGNSRPHKNLEILISSFKRAKTNRKLVIAGTNNSLSINDENIIILGHVQEGELSWLYENSLAFIFPSKYEGFGLPVLEALIKGTKVITSTGGALKEFSDKLVFHFDPCNENELIELLENIESLNKNKEELYIELQKYDWKNIEMELFRNFDIWFDKEKT